MLNLVVMDYELNLSATEFMLFLECPQKFRIYRILNPLPDRETFLNSRRTISSYKLRGYKGKKMNAIGYHHFFEIFHRKYAKVIHQKVPPEEVCEDNIKLMYWVIQQEKYLLIHEDCYWYPVDTEIRLMTDNKRGQIDCLELCEDKNGFRIIDYKSIPHQNDLLVLLFYASLFNDSRLKDEDYGKYDYDILELDCYYYEIGKHKIYNITNKNRNMFDRIFTENLEKIANQEFSLNEKICWSCDFKPICSIEVGRRF